MTRHYDSSRRKQAAEETRQRILQAALKLHWEGVTEFGPLAEEAGCSLPTLRKHFPTKESLYHDCTRTFAETLAMPDIEALAGIDSPGRRLEESVAELCRIHEAMFGYAWLSAQLRAESPTLDAEMNAYDGLVDGITEIVASAADAKRSVVRGFLDFLTYRALRNSGKLSVDEARQELTAAIRPLLTGGEIKTHQEGVQA
jgi:AcrR family transcriptional regulator